MRIYIWYGFVTCCMSIAFNLWFLADSTYPRKMEPRTRADDVAKIIVNIGLGIWTAILLFRR